MALSGAFVALWLRPPANGAHRAAALGACIVLTTGIVWRMRGSVMRAWQLRHDLERQAGEDALTGLPNRRHLFGAHLEDLRERLGARGPEPVRVVVAYIDLDDVHEFNDRFDHDAGDRLIASTGRALAAVAARRPSSIAVRAGGDEFLVVEVLEDGEDPAGAADDLAAVTLEGLRNLRILSYDVSASVGTATDEIRPGEPVERQLDVAINRADLAQAAAKRRGGDCAVAFEADMGEDARRRARLRKDLPSAVERGEVSLAFQPVVDLDVGTSLGVEALLRWKTRDGIAVPPPEAIETAVRLGMIDRFGLDVVRLAIEAIDRYPDFTGRVGVNLAAEQLHPAAVDPLLEMLEGSGLGHRIWLEVTEHAIVEQRRFAAGVLADLRSCGVLVAIDDFGTGYCGLDYLCVLPFDLMKLDAVFIREALECPTRDRVARMAIDLSGTIGADVIVEGIETPEMLDRARDWGCRYGQGYEIARPDRSITVSATV